MDQWKNKKKLTLKSERDGGAAGEGGLWGTYKIVVRSTTC